MRKFISLLLVFVFLFGCIQLVQEQQEQIKETEKTTTTYKVEEIIEKAEENLTSVSEEAEEKENGGYAGPLGEVNFRYKGCGTNKTISEVYGYKFTSIQVKGVGYAAIFCRDFACTESFEIKEGETKVLDGVCIKVNKIVKGYVVCNDYVQATLEKC
ncbi:hypothetical protein JXB01_00135 [Candidatus Micrarchaeota archaeon]|nr:hypothetical protein [Candidatus Micrarchaeota archaeon]